MKPSTFSVVLLLFFFSTLQAQLVPLDAGEAADPFQGTKDLFQNSEMLFLWDNALPNDDIEVKQQIVDYLDAPQLPLNQKLDYYPVQTESGANTNTGSRFLTMAKGNFNGDGFDDVIAAWTNNTGIMLCMPEIDNQTLSWSNAPKVTVGGPLADNIGSYRGRIRLATGNFDQDNEDEFVLAYRNDNDSKIYIEVYDGDSLNTQSIMSISDASLSIIGTYESFDIAVTDFDLDGLSDIVLAYRTSSSMIVKLYTVESGSLIAQTQTTVDDQLNSPSGYVISVCTGDFNQDIIREIAVGWGRVDGNSGATEDAYIQLMQVKDNSQSQGSVLDTIVFDVNARKIMRNSPNEQDALRLKSGDMNDDGKDELLLGRSSGVEIYEVNSNLELTFKSAANSYMDDFQYSDDFFDVADVNRDGSADLVLVKNDYDNIDDYEQQFIVRVFSFDAQLMATKVAESTSFAYQDLNTVSGNTSIVRRHYAVLMGDFDGDRIRVGKGTKYVKTEIVQPLVILNAPPIHFDILNDTIYDVNKCYNDNDCEHKAIYVYQNDQMQRVTTSVSRDWGVSATLGAGGGFAAIGLEASASITAKYGESFSNEQSASQSISVITEVSARDDDLIYATVCDYDAWEYPLYENDTIRGYIMALVPTLTENRWFPSKSWSAYSYVPDHEVGNILSYRPYTALTDNPAMKREVRASYLSDSYVLDANQNYNWTLQFSDFQTMTNNTENRIGLEVAAEVSGWGLSLSSEGTYDQTQMSTHETEVGDQVQISVELRTVDKSLGETGYTVTPYAYWSKNGSLTLDYAVRPEEPAPGGTPTWWTEYYKQLQDPAFILPWRYDPEKGFALQDEEKRRQTKSITFFPDNPQPGDTVRIRARVHNFSLLPTDTAVKVAFYVGDPGNGGTLITGINGETYVYTNGIIESRKNDVVEMNWKYPPGLGASPRIYASIDPDNTLTEIHKNNNIGFNILGVQGFQPVGVEEIAPDTKPELVSKLYPNPAIGLASIQFKLKEPAYVSLKLFDAQGRVLKNLMSSNEAPGLFDVSFDTRELSRGVYFCRLQIGDYAEVQKLVIGR